MKLLGFIFLIVLVLGVFGLFRGWFSVTTAHASGGDEVTLTIDKDKVSDDTGSAADELGRLSARAVEAVKSLGRQASPDETELSGTIEMVDPVTRNLMVDVGGQTIDLHVPAAVPITRDAVAVDFDRLTPAVEVKLFFTEVGEEDRRLARIELQG